MAMAKKNQSKVSVKAPAETISLSDRAYHQLEQLIVTMELSPGAPVSEAQLSELLGIGRTPIREALQRLSREHLVSILPNRGIFIADLNPQKQLRVLETRRELERLICSKAAKRASDSEREEFKRIAKDFEKAAKEKNEELFIRVDKELNDLTILASKNEYAASAMDMLHGMSRRFWFGNFYQVADLPLASKLHADIAKAIAGADEKKAVLALDKLLDYIEAFTRKTVFLDD